jgi:hypothetical protein
MIEVCTPEDILGIPKPSIRWHHGTCNMCERRLTLVLHLNYDKHPRDFQICLKCLEKNSQKIMYGWMQYKVDRTLDELNSED